MSGGVYKLVEVVGTSPTSFAEAVKSGIEEAGKSLHHMGWFEVTELRGAVKDGKVSEYQVTMKIGFKVER
jgi:flavin-binding protein dodecin